MMHRLLLLWQLCCWAGPVAFWAEQVNGADLTTEQPPVETDVLSAETLARTLLDQHDALTALSLVYTQVPKSVEEQPTGDYLRRFIAASREGMFIRDNSHGNKTLDWTEDSFRKTVVVTAAGSSLLENLNRSVAGLDYEHSGEAPKSVSADFIFDVLCWWPFENWSTPRTYYDHAYSMKALLREGAYQVSPQKEVVGSKPCYVFRVNEIYTVWCDCERPQCVLKSEIRNPLTESLATRIEMSDHQSKGGIWLPGQFRIVQFDSEAHTSQLRARIVNDRTFLISDIKVNDEVSTSVFRQNYEPGTIRKTEVENQVRYEPVVEGQAEHFHSILNWSRHFSSRLRAKRDDYSTARQSIFVTSVLVGCVIVFVISRTRSTPRS